MGKVLENQIIGKVKTVSILKKPTETEFGLGNFLFRDEYSIFDFGRMPDNIPGKGESLCRMAVHNFQEIHKAGVRNHFVKSVSPREFQARLVRVIDPGKSALSHDTKNFLVPLEIIFRNSLPEGSSLLKRLRMGVVLPQDFGLKKMPLAGERLEKPIVGFTTKLEASDRHLGRKEAMQLSFLSEKELSEIEQIALAVNDFLNEKAESIGLEHADGKIEMAFSPERELLLADTFGTLDEDRFLFNGVHLSKQILRDYYASTCWKGEIEKKEAGKPYHLEAPQKLPAELLEIVSGIYKSVCQEWIGKKIWNIPSIEETVSDYKNFLEKNV